MIANCLYNMYRGLALIVLSPFLPIAGVIILAIWVQETREQAESLDNHD